eukprot:COSAG01_NODE_1473_length_10193_cov_13.155736_7_plen_205_part_00
MLLSQCVRRGSALRMLRHGGACAPLLLLLGAALLWSLPAPSDAGSDGETLVTPLGDLNGLSHFVRRHKLRLNKAIFFTKSGKTPLAKKLAAEYEGRLDFAIVAESATQLLEQFDIHSDDLPCLRFILSSPKKKDDILKETTDVTTVKYEGEIAKFGAVSHIIMSRRLSPPLLVLVLPAACCLPPVACCCCCCCWWWLYCPCARA